MPSAAHALEVPIAPVDGLRDVVVHVTVVFPDAEVREEITPHDTSSIYLSVLHVMPNNVGTLHSNVVFVCE